VICVDEEIDGSGMLKKRLVIAFDLALWFISKRRTLPIAVVPIVLWPLKRFFFVRTSLLKDVIVLFVVYLVIAVGVVFWKLFQVKHALAYESKLDAELHELDPQEQHELKRLIDAGRMRVGPPLLERIAANTRFIYRDVSGEWRIERQYRWFLNEWNKRTRTT
jgi:hypothetical protein